MTRPADVAAAAQESEQYARIYRFLAKQSTGEMREANKMAARWWARRARILRRSTRCKK